MSAARVGLLALLAAGCAGGTSLTTGETSDAASTTGATPSTGEPTGGVTSGEVTGGTCPEGQELCEGQCVDLAVDAAHCGECGLECQSGSCSAGSCVGCAGGLTLCGDNCVDLVNDAQHCGGCGESCDPGELCNGAQCEAQCSPPELLCGGGCVDPQASEAHCGGCDQPCPAGVACVDGRCPHVDINHVLITGQSLSNGYGSSVVSDMQLYTNLRFATGVRAGAVGLEAFAPLVETWDGKHGETIASGMANLASALWEAAGFTRQDMLVSAHGVDGARYELIGKGTTAYAAGVAQISAGQALAAAQGKSYAVRAVATVHGESDHNDFKATLGNPSYAEHLKTWRADYQADAQAITGQTEPVVMFYCQMSSWTAYGTATSTIPGQQWQVAREQPELFALVGPKYFLPYVDTVHLTGEGSRWLGEYYAKAYARVFLTGEPWRPLEPVAATRRGATIAVDFAVPAPPLVLDTTAVSDPGNYGFEFVDGSMAPPAITGVALTGPEQVTLTLAGEPTGPTPTVRYAYTGAPGATAGPTTGPRGNLRDSDATASLHGYTLYNWAIHFELAVQ